MIRIHNIETNEVVDREMTVAEFKQHEVNQSTIAAIINEAEAKEAARQSILDRLGLTADELQVLLG